MSKTDRAAQTHGARGMMGLWALLVALWGSACTEAPTQIVVVVDPDEVVGSQLAAVQITTRREGTLTERGAGVYDAGAYDLRRDPGRDGHLILRPTSVDDTRALYVTVTGTLRDGSVVRHVALVRFQRARTLYLVTPLVAACARVTCPDPNTQTCDNGRCVAVVDRPLSETPTNSTIMDASGQDLNGAENVAPIDAHDIGADVHDEVANMRDAPVPDVDPARISVPRLVAPISTAIVTQRRPQLRVELRTRSDGAEVEVCRDRDCRMVVTTVTRDGGTPGSVVELVPDQDLSGGVYFWRAFGRLMGVRGSSSSPVWEVRVPARSAMRYAVGPTGTDMNGDGIDDLVVAHSDTRILWGNPAGPSESRMQVFMGGYVVPGDLDQDGLVDLASNTAVPELRVWRGSTSVAGLSTTDSVFALNRDPPFMFSAGVFRISRAGDVNGDGRTDVAFSHYTTQTVFVFGMTAFGEFQHLGTVSDTSAMYYGADLDTIGDFDGDGFSDLVVAGQTGSNVCRVYYGDGSGISSSRSANLADRVGGRGILLNGQPNPVGDVDGDGYFDVACSAESMSTGRYTQCVFYGGSSRTSGRSTCFSNFSDMGTYSGSVADGADFDQDGFSDVVLGLGRATGNAIYVFAGGASGVDTATPSAVIFIPRSEGSWTTQLRASDWNGDGLPDFVASVRANGTYYFENTAGSFRMTPTRTFTFFGVE